MKSFLGNAWGRFCAPSPMGTHKPLAVPMGKPEGKERACKTRTRHTVGSGSKLFFSRKLQKNSVTESLKNAPQNCHENPRQPGNRPGSRCKVRSPAHLPRNPRKIPTNRGTGRVPGSKCFRPQIKLKLTPRVWGSVWLLPRKIKFTPFLLIPFGCPSFCFLQPRGFIGIGFKKIIISIGFQNSSWPIVLANINGASGWALAPGVF